MVFDGYSGVGTTGLACAKENRKAILCEQKPEYFKLGADLISQRINEPELF